MERSSGDLSKYASVRTKAAGIKAAERQVPSTVPLGLEVHTAVAVCRAAGPDGAGGEVLQEGFEKGALEGDRAGQDGPEEERDGDT